MGGGIKVRSEQETNRAIALYSDMIRHICLYHLKSIEDTEDVFQNVFLKYLFYDGTFMNADHEKAWFIRVTINACKDFLKSLFRHKTVPLETLTEEAAHIDPDHREVLEAILSLPAKYKDVIYLYYYEGYSAAEIAAIMNSKENTIYSLLSRGRSILKEKLGGDEFDK